MRNNNVQFEPSTFGLWGMSKCIWTRMNFSKQEYKLRIIFWRKVLAEVVMLDLQPTKFNIWHISRIILWHGQQICAWDFFICIYSQVHDGMAHGIGGSFCIPCILGGSESWPSVVVAVPGRHAKLSESAPVRIVWLQNCFGQKKKKMLRED